MERRAGGRGCILVGRMRLLRQGRRRAGRWGWIIMGRGGREGDCYFWKDGKWFIMMSFRLFG